MKKIKNWVKLGLVLQLFIQTSAFAECPDFSGNYYCKDAGNQDPFFLTIGQTNVNGQMQVRISESLIFPSECYRFDNSFEIDLRTQTKNEIPACFENELIIPREAPITGYLVGESHYVLQGNVITYKKIQEGIVVGQWECTSVQPLQEERPNVNQNDESERIEEVCTQLCDLTQYEQTHREKKRFVCPYEGCGRSISRSDNLTVHKRTHTGEKLYACPYEGCGKSFAQSGSLTKHKRTHTGERPYACSYEGCGRSFAQTSNLYKHQRVHTGERPYVCAYEGCRKSFTQAGSLTEHKRKHAGEKFYCSYEGCGKSFTRPSRLSGHKRRIHSDIVIK